jgi:hypothetical protein
MTVNDARGCALMKVIPDVIDKKQAERGEKRIPFD